MVKDFTGFPGLTEATPVPEVFFSEVLPRMTGLAEIKVFLVALRRIRARKGAVRWVTARELESAPEIGHLPSDEIGESTDTVADANRSAIHEALALLDENGVLVSVPLDDGDTAYFMNDPDGRRAAERVRAGDAPITAAPVRPAGANVLVEPGEVFRLYEDTIGPIPGAGIAEELAEAERTYPAAWIREAFHDAAAQNARRWAYVRAILVRWNDEGRGKDDGAAGRRSAKDRYRGGKYGGVVRWR